MSAECVLVAVASFLFGGLVMAMVIAMVTFRAKRLDRSMVMSEGRRRDIYIEEQNRSYSPPRS